MIKLRIKSMKWKDNPYFILREEFIIKKVYSSYFKVMTQDDIIDPKYHTHIYKDDNIRSIYYGGENTLIVSDKCDPIYNSSLIPDPYVTDSEVELRIYMSDTTKIKEFARLKVMYGR